MGKESRTNLLKVRHVTVKLNTHDLGDITVQIVFHIGLVRRQAHVMGDF